MDAFLTIFTTVTRWIDINPLGSADILFKSASAITVFLCRYDKRRDSIVGTALFICWIYQVYQTAAGDRIAASSDVLLSGILFIVIFSAGGNIMSVVVISKLMSRIKSIWLLIKRPFTFMVKK